MLVPGPWLWPSVMLSVGGQGRGKEQVPAVTETARQGRGVEAPCSSEMTDTHGCHSEDKRPGTRGGTPLCRTGSHLPRRGAQPQRDAITDQGKPTGDCAGETLMFLIKRMNISALNKKFQSYQVTQKARMGLSEPRFSA